MLLGVRNIVKGKAINCRCHILDNSNFNVMTQIVGISRKSPVFASTKTRKYFLVHASIFSAIMGITIRVQMVLWIGFYTGFECIFGLQHHLILIKITNLNLFLTWAAQRICFLSMLLSLIPALPTPQ